VNSTAEHAPAPRTRRRKRRMAPVTAAAAVMALTTSMVIGGAAVAQNAGATAAAPLSQPAVPKYYMALPGGNNFGNVPGAPTAVVGDTITGKRLLTVHPSGKDKFVSVSAAADDTTFVLGANPNPNLELPAPPTPTDWYLVQIKPGAKLRATVRKLRIPAPAANNYVFATAASPDGREVALIGDNAAGAEWLRIYAVSTGALLRSWSGDLNVDWLSYITLSWTSGGRSLAIGYTFSVKASNRYWEYVGVRTLNVRSKGSNLVTDSKLVWSRLTRSTYFSSPTPLNCSLDIRVMVSADGAVVCAAAGLLRVYNPSQNGPTCPSVPPWASLGFLSFSTITGKQSTVFQYNTNCVTGGDDVLWINAAGNTVIGYYLLGTPIPGGNPQIVRFGVFSHDKFSPLPVPPTTTTTPQTIAW
jgi:hypothetical protein